LVKLCLSSPTMITEHERGYNINKSQEQRTGVGVRGEAGPAAAAGVEAVEVAQPAGISCRNQRSLAKQGIQARGQKQWSNAAVKRSGQGKWSDRISNIVP
jgi:hypothetical protein